MKLPLLLALIALALPLQAAERRSPSSPTSSTSQAVQASEDMPDAGRSRPVAPALRYGLDDLLLEAGTLPHAPEADWTMTLRGSAFVVWQPSRSWELRAGARVDGAGQGGGAADVTQWTADVSDTYVRWRGGDTRLTFGAQRVVWGRADAVPLIDRVSRVDLTRFVLDDLPDRRRAQWALRWEQSWDDIKLDAVALPWMRGAALPEVESIWSPVNPTTGRIIGIPPSPELSAFVRAATVDEDDGGSGGGGLRLMRAGESADIGLTLARTRQSVPYYRASMDPARPALTAIHPFQNFAGIDAEWASGEFTWRTEFGYTSGVPATLPTAAMVMTDAVEWIGGVEFFPGGEDTRVTLQLFARSLRTGADILELKHYVGVNGEVETTFESGRWQASLRFAVGANVNDVYVAPTLRYVGWEPHEFYVAAHLFNGEARTPFGFHRDHDLVTVGVRTRF